MMAALFMMFIALQALRRPELLPLHGERPTLANVLRNLLDIWPLVVLVGAVLGSIYAGLATPTESAGLGVVAAIAMGFAFGELTLSQLWVAARQTVGGLGAIFLILIGAVVLGQSISIWTSQTAHRGGLGERARPEPDPSHRYFDVRPARVHL